MDPAADVLGQQAVARHDRLLGDGRPPAQPELGGDVALVHLGSLGEAGILGVLGDDPVEGLDVLQRAAHEDRVPDAPAVVGEEADLRARVRHGSELGQVPAFQALGDGADGAHVAVSCELPQVLDLFDHAGRILDGGRVGHRVDARVPAGGRRLGSGQDGLGVLRSGLAQMRVRVDQPREGDQPGHVDDARASGVDAPADRGDAAAAHVDVARLPAEEPRSPENVFAH